MGPAELTGAIELRLEWFKARAHACRHHEEVALLLQEMDQILTFCNWEASQWRQRADACSAKDPNLREGLRAAACKMAATYDAQKLVFTNQCQDSWVLAADFLSRYRPDGYAVLEDGGE
ncbi:hypothetical protein K488DRAFT_60023 [Vararia minispora EC-137]|uniref:Uncharacterized protein n=1 Tax=Vararia minispora EC-137 TaxID=1314806 RepID=A0ACB8Q807_9AGAM|nr:hypothetical protein K488DRAFT_60023 [Vararia minispora EC-137]